MWREINNNDSPSTRNSAWRGLYNTKSEAVAYEDVMKQAVFDVVFNNCIHNLNNMHNVQHRRTIIVLVGLFNNFDFFKIGPSSPSTKKRPFKTNT
jgi:hypothetical protein